MTYRQYLQYHANNHPSEIKRNEAGALLNIVGDDRKINGHFLTGEKVNRGLFRTPDIKEKQSNGYSATTINRVINPWWVNSYKEYSKNNKEGSGPRPGGGGYDTTVADNARKLAFLNDKLGRMPGQLDLINQAEQNRYAHIEDDYNRANSDLEDSWKQTQEDHIQPLDSVWRAVGGKLAWQMTTSKSNRTRTLATSLVLVLVVLVQLNSPCRPS